MSDKICSSENVGRNQSGTIRDHSNLVNELYRDFNRIDRNNNGGISPSEVDAFLGRPQLTDQQAEAGHFLKDNFDDIARVTGARNNEIKQGDLDYMKEVLSPVNPTAPDGSTISHAVIGGAIGGGVAAYAGNDSVRGGSAKGAAVGLAVGTIAEIAQEHHYNQLQKDREVAANFHYSDCQTLPTAKIDSASVFEKPVNKPEGKPEDLDIVKQKLEKFGETLSKIDFNKDHVVSKDELIEAVKGNYIPDDQKPLAMALAQNIDAVSNLDRNKVGTGLTPKALHELSNALEIDDHTAIHDIKTDRAGLMAVTGAAGAFWGTIIGACVGGPPGAAIGAGIGIAVGAGATYFFRRNDVEDTKQWQSDERNGVLKNTIRDLQHMD